MSASPSQLKTMIDLRAEIDATDRALVKLLAYRAGLIDRAIELKPGEGLPARIETRIEEVVGRVRDSALAEGLDPELIETLWRQLIDWSIAREEQVLGTET
jgi:isochorismate pyruvate lyase